MWVVVLLSDGSEFSHPCCSPFARMGCLVASRKALAAGLLVVLHLAATPPLAFPRLDDVPSQGQLQGRHVDLQPNLGKADSAVGRRQESGAAQTWSDRAERPPATAAAVACSLSSMPLMVAGGSLT